MIVVRFSLMIKFLSVEGITIRKIHVGDITEVVANLCQDANYFLGADVLEGLRQACVRQESPTGRDILVQLLENADIAGNEQLPICQDTGFAVVFVELGQDVVLTGGDFYDAVNAGVRLGYREGYLRKSIVKHPLHRENTGDNTPAVIHVKIVPGDKIKLILAPKGGGSENMSAVKMLKPADGIAGVKDFVVEVVRNAGPNACPPVVVGVGIGGTMEKAALLSKEALLRELGQAGGGPDIAQLEAELLEEINRLGIGPQGLGGRITALAVHIETYPTHIASLPVAVSLNCHVARHKEAIL